MGEDHSSDEDSMSDDSNTDHSQKDSVSTPSAAGECIVHEETKAVNFSKRLVYQILLITGAALGVSMYFFLSGKEHDDFESQVCCSFATIVYMHSTGQINMCIF